MKKKVAKIVVEYGGKKYRVGKSHVCSKRNCSLFLSGVCDAEADREHFPCEPILEAFEKTVETVPNCCFKEVK